MSVKINNKNYTVPKMTFDEFVRIESDLEANILKAFQKKQILVITAAAIMFVTGEDKEQAGFLAEQHLAGGGKLDKVTGAFTEALSEATFFKKMLGIEEAPAKGKSAKAKIEEIPTEE